MPPMPPLVPFLQPWEEVPFRRVISGWTAFAEYVNARSGPPHKSVNAHRLHFWAGGLPGIEARRTVQGIIFSADAIDAALGAQNTQITEAMSGRNLELV